jgi:hypothetical protein
MLFSQLEKFEVRPLGDAILKKVIFLRESGLFSLAVLI